VSLNKYLTLKRQQEQRAKVKNQVFHPLKIGIIKSQESRGNGQDARCKRHIKVLHSIMHSINQSQEARGKRQETQRSNQSINQPLTLNP